MSLGLKLTEQITLNKAHIIEVTTFENQFHILITGSFSYMVWRENDLTNYPEPIENAEYIIVSVSEYHRIQRELSDYLGLELKDYKPGIEVVAKQA